MVELWAVLAGLAALADLCLGNRVPLDGNILPRRLRLVLISTFLSSLVVTFRHGVVTHCRVDLSSDVVHDDRS